MLQKRPVSSRKGATQGLLKFAAHALPLLSSAFFSLFFFTLQKSIFCYTNHIEKHSTKRPFETSAQREKKKLEIRSVKHLPKL